MLRIDTTNFNKKTVWYDKIKLELSEIYFVIDENNPNMAILIGPGDQVVGQVTRHHTDKNFLDQEEMELFKQCDGKHDNLADLFDCPSCSLLFRDHLAKKL